jgi:DNA-directed RNA polymerase specialized sigma24 family protein
MVSGGHSLQTTSKMLAHSDIATTARVYAHLDLNNVRTAINSTLSTIFEPSSKSTNVNLEELKQAIDSLPDAERKAFLVQFL